MLITAFSKNNGFFIQKMLAENSAGLELEHQKVSEFMLIQGLELEQSMKGLGSGKEPTSVLFRNRSFLESVPFVTFFLIQIKYFVCVSFVTYIRNHNF